MNSLRNTPSKVIVNLLEDDELSILDLRPRDRPEVSSHIVDKVLLFSCVKQVPQATRLLKVPIGKITGQHKVSVRGTIEHFLTVVIPDLRVNSTARADKVEPLKAGLDVGTAALGYERSRASTLVVGDGNYGCIARELLVVNSESVALRIGINEETTLEKGIGRMFNERDQVGWRKGQLLNLVEEVFRIPVQDKLADRAKREVLMRPDFGDVECEEAVRALCLFGRHRLNVDSILGEVAALDGFVQQLGTIVRVCAS